MSSVKINGGKEVAAFLSAFPKRLGNNGVRAGLTAGAAVIRDEARRTVRKRSGKLAKAIKSGSARVNEDGTVSIKVRVTGKHSYLAPWIEYGTKPHWIRVADGAVDEVNARLGPSKKAGGRARATTMKRLNQMVREGSLVINGHFVGPEVLHPGNRSFPFMRPAAHTKAQAAVKAFGERIQSYMKDKTGFNAPAIAVDDA